MKPNPVLVIAEGGLNHFGSLPVAKEMALAAKQAGADIFKGQWYDPETILGRHHPYIGEAKKAQFSAREHKELKDYCETIGIEWAVSIFDTKLIEYTEKWDMKRYKIASRAALNYDLVLEINRTRKPVILSNGLLNTNQLIHVLNMLHCCKTTILYCVCKYPCQESDIDLKKMVALLGFSSRIGFSSHCPQIAPTLAAIELGAHAIEHHVALDKNVAGCDISSSITFNQLKEITNQIGEICSLRH